MSVPGYGGPKAKKTMRAEGKEALSDVAKQTPKTKRRYVDLEQFYIGGFDLRVGADEEAHLQRIEDKMMRRGGAIPSIEGNDFKHLALLLKIKPTSSSYI